MFQLSPVLDPRGRMEGLRGKVVRTLRTVKVVYWLTVFESSGAGSCGLSEINGLNSFCFCCCSLYLA